MSVSAYIVYTSFFAVPGSVTLNLSNVTTDTSSLLNVKALDNQIESSIKNLGPDGSWSKLESSQQYQALTPEANIGVQIGVFGQKPNPFIKLKYSTSTNAE